MQMPDFGASGRAARDQRQATWAAGTTPQAMLAVLRVCGLAADRVPSPHQAIALRRFAVRCARQRLVASPDADGASASDAVEQAIHLTAVADGLVSGHVAPEAADAIRRVNAAVARRAAEQLLDPSVRIRAAMLLAAFHALEPDPFAAARRASRVIERYAAFDERDAQRVSAEQGAWLHELFGPALAVEDAPESMVAEPWEDDGRWEPELAMRLRLLRRHRAALLAFDPWTPVPQVASSYLFGTEQRPLPVGALCLLWDRWGVATGTCPACLGHVVAFAVGGGSKRGGVLGCCLVCERRLRRELGGIRAVAASMMVVLEGTAYGALHYRHPMQPPAPGTVEEFDSAVAVVVTWRAAKGAAI